MPKKFVILPISLIVISGVLAVYSKNSFKGAGAASGDVFGSATYAIFNLPQEIVIPEDSKVLSSTKSRNSSQITLETLTSELDLGALWKRNLTENGWKETGNLHFIKGNNTVTVSLTMDTATKNTIATVSFFGKD